VLDDLFNFGSADAIAALVVVVVMFVEFIRERYPAEVVALGGVAAMLLLGILPYDAGLDVLSNPAPWTIAAMFVVMGALVRTGALDWFTQLAASQADARPAVAIGALMAFVMLASALIPGFFLEGWGAGFWTALWVSLFSVGAFLLTGQQDQKFRRIVVRQRGFRVGGNPKERKDDDDVIDI